MQTHEEHFQQAVECDDEKGGLNRGRNTAVTDRKEPQGEYNTSDLTLCFAGTCDDSRDNSIQDKNNLLPPRGLEPLEQDLRRLTKKRTYGNSRIYLVH